VGFGASGNLGDEVLSVSTPEFSACEGLHARGHLDAAEPCYLRVLCRSPSLAEAWHGLGVLFFQTHRVHVSLTAISKAITILPKVSLFFANRAKVLQSFGESVSAGADLWRGLTLDPDGADLLCDLGANQLESGKHDLALTLTLRCLVLDAAHARGHCHLGAIFDRAGMQIQALLPVQRALMLDPALPEAWYNLAGISMSLDDIDTAAEGFRLSALAGVRGALPELNTAFLHLLAGKFAEGWALYEERWRDDEFVRSQRLLPGLRESRPAFTGPGPKRVLVWAEQGVGDEVMFGGLVGEFRGLCGEVLLQVDRRLMGLFERALPGVRVFERGKTVPAELYDEQIPMGSLGKWLRPTRESFEGKGGRYLKAQEGLGRRLRAELGVGASEKLIGLSWRSASAETGAARSLSLKALVGALQGVEGVRFLNLQYGEVSEELRALREETGVEVLTHPGIDNREDLEGLAGLIEGCDLVVSVGNATAHLSGALGQKTWVLLPPVAARLPTGMLIGGWRWLREGVHCPWYQSIRLCRQVERECWEPVFSALREGLALSDYGCPPQSTTLS
jgi:Flp pilus assembly protein TadD